MRLASFPSVAPAFLCLLFSISAAAQTPVQVADLNTTRYDSSDNFFFATEFVELSGTVYFSASDGLQGLELWKTDGTAAGTVRITDLCPGSCDSLPRNLTVFGGSIVFSADDGAHGFEPWITDGTTAGTHIILDAVPGLAGSTPNLFRPLAGKLIYTASDFAAGQELWTTDGTVGGTQRLVDVRPGPTGSSPVLWRVLGTDLLFEANDGIHGAELWATDGSAAGTRLVLDIAPGAGAALPGLTPVPGGLEFFAVLGSRLFFAASDGTTGLELWATDGTAAGTSRVADVNPGTGDSTPNDFEPLGSTLLFRANDGTSGPELWRTDGTGAGTVRVADLNAGSSGSSPYELTSFGGAIYFHADDGVHGRELWKSDGTEPGTTMLADIGPGSAAGLNLFQTPHGLIPVSATKMLFFSDDGTTGNELWVTDGTPAGTARVVDLNPGTLPSDVGSFAGGREVRVVSGGKLYFRVFDAAIAEGRQLYTSDGTAAGTSRVKRLVEQRSGVALPYFGRTVEPGQTAALAGKLIFAGDDGTSGAEPAASDGTVSGTIVLKDVRPGLDSPTPGEMTAVGSRVLFRATEGTNNDASLWATDGTPAGTAALTGPVLVQPSSLTAFGGKAYFTGFDAAHGAEVWSSDGTPGGTGLAFDLVPGVIGSVPTAFTPLGTNLFFTAGDTSAGNELWVTDGATAHRVADIRPGAVESSPAQLTASPTSGFGPSIYFSADDGVHGRELWVSDGTEAGTRIAADVNPGAGSSMAAFPIESFAGASSRTLVPFSLSGPVAFAADDGVSGEELWVSGPFNTFLLRDIFPGSTSSQPRQLTPVGRKVAFVADDGVHGRELWVTSQSPIVDGPMVLDLWPGAASSLPQHLTGFGGLVLFSADDGTHGREPWVTDGTPQGTRRFADLAPGDLPSSPYDFSTVGGDFYFAASDAVSGFELWRVPRSAFGARLSATKTVSGPFVPGGIVTYTVVITNSGLGAQLRTAGVPFEDTIPAGLTYLSATSSSGFPVVVLGSGSTQVAWAGEIPAGGQVTITIRCQIPAGTAAGTSIANQATIHYDSDGDLVDDVTLSTDDPTQPGGSDATAFRVGLGFYTVPPCRAFDNRTGPPLLNGSAETVTIGGVCGIPETAKAVAFNLTAITPTGAGFLRAYPSGAAPTLVSQVNFSSGQTRTNNGIVEIGADGKIVVQAALTGGALAYVFDVVGYFE